MHVCSICVLRLPLWGVKVVLCAVKFIVFHPTSPRVVLSNEQVRNFKALWVLDLGKPVLTFEHKGRPSSTYHFLRSGSTCPEPPFVDFNVPPHYARSETAPLLPNWRPASGKRRGNVWLKFLVVMVVTAIILFTVNLLARILDPIGAGREWEKLRREWDRERLARQGEREEHQLEREEWDRERLAWKAEREEWDTERSERHKKELSVLYWQQPQPAAQCSSYGTREYTARLWRDDLMGLCQQVSINIHGKTIEAPEFCEDRGPWGGLIGHWKVNFGETGCHPHWGSLLDKGCVADKLHTRRAEAQLLDIQSGDWDAMCATTPAHIHGQQFDSPTSCENRGFWGVFGIWDYPAPEC